jgi:hypothetical protein
VDARRGVFLDLGARFSNGGMDRVANRALDLVAHGVQPGRGAGEMKEVTAGVVVVANQGAGAEQGEKK